MTTEEYRSLARSQKVKKILPKVLPLLLLSVILPTADVWTDLGLIADLYTGLPVCAWSDGMLRDYDEWSKCFDVGPEQYCTPETVSTNNTVCGLKDSSDSPYFCRNYTLWSSEWKDYIQCRQGAEIYCSDPASNQNVCTRPITHPKIASSLFFFFLLNYGMGLLTCWRLEGRQWVPLIAALLTVYPQYCK